MSDAREDTGYQPPLPAEPGHCKRCGRKPENGVLVSVAPSAVRDTCGGCAGKLNAARPHRGKR